jgi:adenylate cyclase
MPDSAMPDSASVASRGEKNKTQISLATLGGLGWVALGVATSTAGALVVTLLLLLQGTSDDIENHRNTFLLTAAGYVVFALIIGSVWTVFLQRRTISWFGGQRDPSAAEARQALRLPVDAALVSALLWALGVIVLSVLAGVLGSVKDAFDTALTVGLGGVTTVGLTYLATELAARPITTTALEKASPNSLSITVLRRLVLTWALASGVPLLGILLIVTPPDLGHNNPKVSLIVLSAGGLFLGVLGIGLLARGVASPLHRLKSALDQIARGDTSLRVGVDDASEIGLLQNSVNSMVASLREQDRMRDLFGRHVGADVARYALEFGASLSGDLREVTALFVDVVDSTGLAIRTPPNELVTMLNQLFSIVVEAVDARGGLVNQFQGDATLCIFGAPLPLANSAGAALSAAREIRDRVRGQATEDGGLDLGIGISTGSVFAGQLGTIRRLQYTVIGDPVNEAARLSDRAKQVEDRILASDQVISLSDERERSYWRENGEMLLRGRTKPTMTWISVDH